MKKNIAIIMGGYSSEVEISLKSGAVVYQNLSKEKYNTYKVHILKNKWVLVDDAAKEYPINKHDFSAEVNGKKITVPAICLEEESCQVMERNGEYDVYNLSRLGIPLIEIATGPDAVGAGE